MIYLKTMESDEFPEYRKLFIKDYGQELALNYAYSSKKANLKAQQEIDEDLPDGALTTGNEVKTIVLGNGQESKTVGYLWYVQDKKGDSVFIYDFFVFEQFRSQGYGRLALKALEEMVIQEGVENIKLRVAYSNQRALKLYKELGFGITGINMMKALS